MQWNPARKRYVVTLNAFMGVYVFLVVLISGWLGWEPRFESWPGYVIAVLPALPIAGAIWAMGRYLDEEPDEFQRMLLARAMLIGAGMTMFVCTAWGFLAHYAHVWELPLFLVFPLFCVCFGVSNIIVRWRNL